MSFSCIQAFQERVIHCENTTCPLRSLNKGYFPRPPRGSERSKIMMIFESPGIPNSINLSSHGNPEMQDDINTIQLSDALTMSIQGQKIWLSRQVGIDLFDKYGFTIGENVYTTDAIKCVKNGVQIETARRQCIGYLKEEISLVKPLIIIAFGDYARVSLSETEGVRWNGSIKALSDDDRIKYLSGRMYALLVHPDGYWKKPAITKEQYRATIQSVFEQAVIFIKSQSA